MERILILGATPLTAELLREIASRPCGCRVVGVLDDVAPVLFRAGGQVFTDQLCQLPSAVDRLQPTRIVIALAERRGRMPMRALLDSYVSRGIVIEDAAGFYERITEKLALEWLTPARVIESGKFQPSAGQRCFARALSFMFALAALTLLAPLMIAIAVAIKLDSKGPVLFRQPRVGLRGRAFTLLKFRTMHCERTGRSEWECDNRDRVTRVGKWLRRFRVDELPQFVNVLRGEMNLVGPRPHPVTNLELLTLVARNLNEVAGMAVGCYALRLVVPPGITGWAQVRYRYANNLDEEIEKLRYDLHYIKHMSPLLDLRIICETLAVMVRGSAQTATPNAAANGAAAERGVTLFRRLRRSLAQIGLALAIMIPAPCLAQALPDPAAADSTGEYEYVIGASDVLEVAVWQNTAISRTVPVRPDGKISLPVLNDVQAAGLTPMQLQSVLTKSLAKYMQTPEVSVIVREVNSFTISVIGHVTKPGRHTLTSRVTVLEALALAGGLTEYADRDRIVIVRRTGAITKQLPFAYDKVVPGNGAKGQVNFFVQPDDIILVR